MCHVPEHMKIQLQQQQQLINALHNEIQHLRANPYKKPINAKQKLYETIQRNPQGLRSKDFETLGYCKNTLYTTLNELIREGKIEKYHVMRLHREQGKTGVKYRAVEALVHA